MAARFMLLAGLLSLGATNTAGDTDFDKISQFLSALDAEVAEDTHRKLYSMDYDDCVDTDGCATDPFGDGCAAYDGYPSWCGLYDDDDFSSMSMCCICGDSCTDTDNGAADTYGDACAAYEGYPSWCGGFDDDDFSSMTMCCACDIYDDADYDDGPSPTPPPTAGYTISTSLTLAGIACADYGDDEEDAVNSGLVTALLTQGIGLEVENIGPHSCAAAARRRSLLTAGSEISFTISFNAASDTTATSMTGMLTTALAAIVSDGSLTAAIVAADTSGNLASVSVTGFSADLDVDDTAAPTASPVTVVITAGAGSTKPALTALALVAAWALRVVV